MEEDKSIYEEANKISEELSINKRRNWMGNMKMIIEIGKDSCFGSSICFNFLKTVCLLKIYETRLYLNPWNLTYTLVYLKIEFKKWNRVKYIKCAIYNDRICTLSNLWKVLLLVLYQPLPPICIMYGKHYKHFLIEVFFCILLIL